MFLVELYVHSCCIFNNHFFLLIVFQLNNYPPPNCHIGLEGHQLILFIILCTQITEAHAHRKHSSKENDAFVFPIMAGIGAVSPLQLHHQKIKKALEYRQIYTVTYHNKPHISGGDEEKSCLDQDVDPYKIVAALINYPRHFEHKQTHSGVNSVTYETWFSKNIGTCQPEDANDRGHIVYIKIQEKHNQNFTQNFDYFVLIILISETWRITSPNGPQCQQNPNQRQINYKSVLKSKADSQPWA